MCLWGWRTPLPGPDQLERACLVEGITSVRQWATLGTWGTANPCALCTRPVCDSVTHRGGGGVAQGLGIRLFAFGGAYWPLATAHSDPLWVSIGGGGGGTFRTGDPRHWPQAGQQSAPHMHVLVCICSNWVGGPCTRKKLFRTCNPPPVRGKNFPLYGPLCGADLFW